MKYSPISALDLATRYLMIGWCLGKSVTKLVFFHLKSFLFWLFSSSFCLGKPNSLYNYKKINILPQVKSFDEVEQAVLWRFVDILWLASFEAVVEVKDIWEGVIMPTQEAILLSLQPPLFHWESDYSLFVLLKLDVVDLAHVLDQLGALLSQKLNLLLFWAAWKVVRLLVEKGNLFENSRELKGEGLLWIWEVVV